MDADEAIAALQELEREFARLHAVQAELLVAASSPERWVDEFLILDPRPGHDEERTVRICDAVREEIAVALRWSFATTQSRIDAARLLCGSLVRTKDALAAGTITAQHAAVIVEAAERVPDHHQELQDRVLKVAGRSTVSRTRQAANRAVLSIDAEGADRRRRRARCNREVFVVDELDGISTIIARLATERAHAVMSLINGVAHASAADGASGSIGELRSEALEFLVLGDHTDAQPAIRTHLNIVVSLDALTGESDSPAELAGSGSISIDAVRELLADGSTDSTVRMLVSDPTTGHLLDMGRSTYRIPDRLREFIVTRDRTCRFPGCARRASRCQIDHAEAWDDGGSTDVRNLGVLCVRHHQLKSHGGWRLQNSRADGSCEWISPRGRRYEIPARAAP